MNGGGLQALLAAAGLLVLIFDGPLALEGAREGIDLCIRTVIPGLFPFFVLSGVLTRAMEGSVPKPLQRLAAVLGIPGNAAAVLIPALLGGYPVGAKCIGDLYRQKQLRRDDAERMLGFCSNAGPSFLFGVVSVFFPERKTVWLLWLLQLCSAGLTSLAIPFKKTDSQRLPDEVRPASRDLLLSSALSMLQVCCWVVLFRILMVFSRRWFFWMLPPWAQVLAMGFLELTNGCCCLEMVPQLGLRFLLCGCMLSFGGICVLFQTISVTRGLSAGSYIRGKLMQTAFSFLLGCLVLSRGGLCWASAIPILVILLRKTQNRYGNPESFPV